MTRRGDRVSIVIPAFNEGENLVDTVRCVLENTAYPDFEIVVVDDGSTDGSGDRLANVIGKDGRVGVVRIRCQAGSGMCLGSSIRPTITRSRRRPTLALSSLAPRVGSPAYACRSIWTRSPDRNSSFFSFTSPPPPG